MINDKSTRILQDILITILNIIVIKESADFQRSVKHDPSQQNSIVLFKYEGREVACKRNFQIPNIGGIFSVWFHSHEHSSSESLSP